MNLETVIGRICWGSLGGDSRVDVHEAPVVCPRLPAGLEGVRIALLTDLHFGKHCGVAYTRRVMDLALAERPDLVVLGGDMIDASGRRRGALADAFAPFAERVGLYAVMGNHDRGNRPRATIDAMTRAGVHVLVNEHRILHPRGAAAGRLALVGLDDLKLGRPDCPAAFTGIEEGTFTVVAGHNPDLADRVGPARGVDLMLAGHTHAGQIRIFGRAPITFIRSKDYVVGLVRGPGFPLYVSRGLGYTAIPLRIGSDPELPILVLRRNPQ